MATNENRVGILRGWTDGRVKTAVSKYLMYLNLFVPESTSVSRRFNITIY